MFKKSPRAGALVLALVLSAAERARAEEDGLPLTDLPRPRARAARELPTTITTAFDPTRDGFPFVNQGDFGGPDGNCLGMSLMAIDNLHRRAAAGRAGRSLTASGSLESQETVSLAQAVASTGDIDGRMDAPVSATIRKDDPSRIRAALERMARTREPQVFVLATEDGRGHANVLYGFKDGKLQLYDPNFPGETVQWPFDPVTGLGAHPKANPARPNDFYANVAFADAAAFSSFHAAADLARLRSVCARGAAECTGRYPTVEATVSGDGSGGAVVSGKVSGGPARTIDGEPTRTVTQVYAYVDEKPVGYADVAADGTYRLPLDGKVFSGGTHDLRVVAFTGDDPWTQQLAGFVEKRIPKLDLGAPSASKGITQALGGATSAGSR